MKESGPLVYAPAPATNAPLGRNVENSYPIPQPALSVKPASCTLSKMPSILSSTMPDTVQLIVLVAGLCSKAPAFDVIRPAGIAPRRKAHKNFSCHSARLPSSSTSAKARATRE